jgi:dihydrodipicolinate synthase/N-acetylneuraminate lyase
MWRERLQAGLVIPACPLALTRERKFDETRQRGLIHYYQAAGAGGLAVGVHTTQFAIRQHGLFRPILELAASEFTDPNFVPVAGICGPTAQAAAEASLARELGYHAALLSLGAMSDASEDQLLAHCEAIAEILPLFGFYLQPAVGGRILPHRFWRRFAEIQNVVAIKIAPFNRYQTLDVIRAVVEADRPDIALYTGNDDNIVADLVTPFRFERAGQTVERRIVGGLLGQWAVWTKPAVTLLAECHRAAKSNTIPSALLALGVQLTDAGCIPGIHEILRRQGLLEGTWSLDPHEQLSPGQADEIDRVIRAYPHLTDSCFAAEPQ